jgi:hypothetical protein
MNISFRRRLRPQSSSKCSTKIDRLLISRPQASHCSSIPIGSRALVGYHRALGGDNRRCLRRIRVDVLSDVSASAGRRQRRAVGDLLSSATDRRSSPSLIRVRSTVCLRQAARTVSSPAAVAAVFVGRVCRDVVRFDCRHLADCLRTDRRVSRSSAWWRHVAQQSDVRRSRRLRRECADDIRTKVGMTKNSKMTTAFHSSSRCTWRIVRRYFDRAASSRNPNKIKCRGQV